MQPTPTTARPRHTCSKYTCLNTNSEQSNFCSHRDNLNFTHTNAQVICSLNWKHDYRTAITCYQLYLSHFNSLIPLSILSIHSIKSQTCSSTLVNKIYPSKTLRFRLLADIILYITRIIKISDLIHRSRPQVRIIIREAKRTSPHHVPRFFFMIGHPTSLIFLGAQF